MPGTNVILFAALIFTSFISQPGSSAALNSSRIHEIKTMNLSEFGFAPVHYPPNSVLRTGAAAVLQNYDPNTHIFFVDDNDVLIAYRILSSTDVDSVRILALDVKNQPSAKEMRIAISRRRSRDELIDGQGVVTKLKTGTVAVVAKDTIYILDSSLQQIARCDVQKTTTEDRVISVQPYNNGESLFVRFTNLEKHESSFEILNPYTCRQTADTPTLQLPASASDVLSIGHNLIFREGAKWMQMTTTREEAMTSPLLGEQDVLAYPAIAADHHSLAMISTKHAYVLDSDYRSDHDDQANVSFQVTLSDANQHCAPGPSSLSDQNHVLAIGFSCARKSKDVHSCGNGRDFAMLYKDDLPSEFGCIPLTPTNGDNTLTISPDGTRLVVFDGSKLHLYELGSD